MITETIAGLTGRRIAGTGITLSVQKAGQGAPLMAQEVVARMAAPGLSQAAVPGGDRGRMACGLALNHPGQVTGTGITEIAPTSDDRAA